MEHLIEQESQLEPSGVIGAVGPGSPRACLMLHGFTGGPFELKPLAELLMTRGWACTLPTLPGHEGPLEQLGTVHHSQWLEAVHQEAELLAQQWGEFDLIGFSMGGMLALDVAARYPVRRLVLLNAAAIYVSPGRFMREWLRQKRNGEVTARTKIKQTPFRATWEFMRLVHAVRPRLKQVKAPTLILQGLRDPVVHPLSAVYLSKRLGGPRQVRFFPQSRHLLCLDCESDQVSEEVVQFLNQH